MDAVQLKRLKELEEENQRLKRMFADLSLDHALLKDVLKPPERKEGAEYLVEERNASTTRACRVVNLPRSMWYYKSVKDDSELEAKLQELADQLPYRGIDTYYGRLKAQGYPWRRKRVLRVYRKLNMQATQT